ncbi:hypothetical protein FOA52_009848 [Chlamydomonas sp. UWO 241]|nr:hypothetical protein FOA52_009848 [Chlamydomonas sp. UWO 241]
MQAIQDVQLDTAACHAVIFSPDLSPQLLLSLDRASKVALRCVNRAMRSQVDASIKVVASPVSGFSADVLSAALVRWSGMHDLTLLAVSDDADLEPLATASLAGLTSLTVRQQAPQPYAGADLAFLDMPTLGSSVAATLRVIDISDCWHLTSIGFVRSCVQLRCLWMPGCFSVTDLSPLAACSETLEELWMAVNGQVVSLEPLKACNKLRKLDLRECDFDAALYDQVKDLQLACTQTSVELEGLVHDLQLNMLDVVQASAARTLACMTNEGLAAQTVIASAGAIPALVKLLQHESSAGVQMAAAGALECLAANHAQNQAAITAAGAIPALTRLQGPEFPINVQMSAADTLRNLPEYSNNGRSE